MGQKIADSGTRRHFYDNLSRIVGARERETERNRRRGAKKERNGGLNKMKVGGCKKKIVSKKG